MPAGVETESRPFDAFVVHRYHVDLWAGSACHEALRCADLDDALGGIARAFKILDPLFSADPYDPAATLVMNLGLLSGTRVMTGLRTYFSGYSPLKASQSGNPGLMWSAGSGDFGPRLRGLGIDDVVFRGRCARPTLIHMSPGGEAADGSAVRFRFLDASDLLGLTCNEKIQELHRRFPEAQFAVIGPGGEHFAEVSYGAVALSTGAQVQSGEPKPRFCGRGGFGGVLGSKNVIAIAADSPGPRGGGHGLKETNRKISLGPGSIRFRDVEGAQGGTWRIMQTLQEIHALPEYNFRPAGTDVSLPLLRPSVEAGPWRVRAEGCYLCGIRCHRDVYEQAADGSVGPFRIKVDYEPICLLSSNLGIFEPTDAFDLIRLGDEYGLDSISLGVTLGYAMEYNQRHPEAPIAGGLSYGDAEAVRRAIVAIGTGQLPELGRGVKQLSEQTGEAGYAMHSKGVEYPAYLPHTNPGYPWALAGGHMSMRTFFLLINERETGLDYWVDAITNRGPMYMLDDISGLCKFAAIDPAAEAEAIRITAGLDVCADDLTAAVRRTYVRGYANERRHGFSDQDYSMPAESHEELSRMKLPYFITPEFFADLRNRVLAVLDERAGAAGLLEGRVTGMSDEASGHG